MNIRPATAKDASKLHTLAASTFPLACPPATTREAIADFIAAYLSEASFAGYLADSSRLLFIGEVDGEPAGYTMIIVGEPTDSDVAAAVAERPTAELSKCYALPSAHGTGLAAALVRSSVAAARARGARSVWLGVNNENARAKRFYEKCGFAVVGMKKFLLGDRYEEDFVLELALAV